MQLNWRRIILVIVCAECLFIYWNSLSTMSFKKQQTTQLGPTNQPKAPLTHIPQQIPNNPRIDSDLHTKEKAS
ncbi:hypothetical protein [Paenibacillus qinlingensis]|uniref:Uncharacterized protein n=1 Tax=Paenibacillus qinlingensis TaxID=1837343 RepID=A0ABU1NN44_9BACL|nr:hypothetical protein [Paenibacillus qinlingensis]MDR6548881.1 hypothetical protein [Paenibacillus qinlingensis]